MLHSCLEKLKSSAVRETPTRKVLLQVLHAATAPLSPPEILDLCHQAGRKANKTTVYRDLSLLERSGLIQKVIVSDRKQYFELTERGHHHHFICTRCERVEDVELDETSLLSKAVQLSKKLRFTIAAHSMEFYGQCLNCSGKIN